MKLKHAIETTDGHRWTQIRTACAKRGDHRSVEELSAKKSVSICVDPRFAFFPSNPTALFRMKSALSLPLVSLLFVPTALAQPVQKVVPPDQAADGVYRVVELGPHHKTWQRVIEVQDENGFLQPRTNSYVELATAMNRWDPVNQEWTEASDEIEILEEGAVARKSQHLVSFSGNLNDPNGTIDLLTPDGKTLRSRVIGLAYTERTAEEACLSRKSRNAKGLCWGATKCFTWTPSIQ